jgi:hypothetical protein
MALKRCVTIRAPAANAARASPSPQPLCPRLTITPASANAATCAGLAASGASVTTSAGRRAAAAR